MSGSVLGTYIHYLINPDPRWDEKDFILQMMINESKRTGWF